MNRPDMNRPEWDNYFMSLCFVVAQRSIDPSTKHGCVVTSCDRTILSVGFNGPPRNCDDTKIPLTRPEKYSYLLHAEECAFLNAARTGVSLNGSTCYVTGFPCERCVRQIINVGCKRVVYGPVSSHCISKDSKDITYRLLSGQDIKFELIDCSSSSVYAILENASKSFWKYCKTKNGS